MEESSNGDKTALTRFAGRVGRYLEWKAAGRKQ
jgi:hypothetical protein